MESEEKLRALVERMAHAKDLREVVIDKESGIINPDVLREIAEVIDASERRTVEGGIELR